jgi:TolB-like protein
VDELLADLDGGRAGALARLPRGTGRALLVLAVLAAGSLAYRICPRERAPAAATPAPTSVAVLPLLDQTAEPSLAWTSAGTAEMLASELAEAAQLRVVDPARVRRTLGDLKLTNVTAEPELRRLADLMDGSRIVPGTVRRAGPPVRADLRLVRVRDDRVDAQPIGGDTPDAAGLFSLIAELADRLRHELDAPRPPDRGRPGPPTASVEAAEAYRQARHDLLKGNAVAAAPALERAVEADPGFAAAFLDLSEARQALGQRDQAVAAAERAAAGVRRDRLAWARARAARSSAATWPRPRARTPGWSPAIRTRRRPC